MNKSEIIINKFEEVKPNIVIQNLLNRQMNDFLNHFDVLKNMVFSGIEFVETLLKSEQFKKFVDDAENIYKKSEELISAIEEFANKYFCEMFLSYGKEIEKDIALTISFSTNIFSSLISECFEDKEKSK